MPVGLFDFYLEMQLLVLVILIQNKSLLELEKNISRSWYDFGISSNSSKMQLVVSVKLIQNKPLGE